MLLEAKDIRVSFRKENQTRLFGRERQEVLHGLSIDLKEGECLGIIGESGSGKSTFGRVLCGLLAPDSGTVRLDGLDLYGRLPRADKARIQSSISIVFQDYTTSANPRFRVQGIIGESFRAMRLKGANISREAQRKETIELLERVGLDESFLTRYPHELSGGQLQRVMIAAAIVTDPHLLLLDEPTTALDVTVQAQILALLRRLNWERGISMLLISHNLQVVRRICSRVAVMQRGHIVEEGAPEQLFTAPQHPYTAELINAIPRRVRRG